MAKVGDWQVPINPTLPQEEADGVGHVLDRLEAHLRVAILLLVGCIVGQPAATRPQGELPGNQLLPALAQTLKPVSIGQSHQSLDPLDLDLLIWRDLLLPPPGSQQELDWLAVSKGVELLAISIQCQL